MKLKVLLVERPIQVGGERLTCLKYPQYDMTIDGQFVSVRDITKANDTVFTPLTNVTYFTQVDSKKPEKKVVSATAGVTSVVF